MRALLSAASLAMLTTACDSAANATAATTATTATAGSPAATTVGANPQGAAGAVDPVVGGTVAGTTVAERPLAVRVVPVSHQDLREELAYVGTVRPRRQVKVAARVGGTALAHQLEEGADVKAGAVLLEILAPELQARASSVAAERARVRALERQACAVARTDRRLARSGALPTARADASGAQCQSARAAVGAVKGKQREVGISLGRRRAKASIAGKLLRWLVEPGETVGPGRPLALLAVGVNELEIQVTDTDLVRGVRVGGMVRLAKVGADGATTWFPARVLRIAPMAMGPLRHIAVRVALPSAFAALPPGSALDARLLLAEAKGVTSVPMRAVVHGVAPDGASITYVVIAKTDVARGRDARSLRHVVTLGIRDGAQVAIAPALPPGTQVVTSNLASLRSGQPLFTVSERVVTTQEVRR